MAGDQTVVFVISQAFYFHNVILIRSSRFDLLCLVKFILLCSIYVNGTSEFVFGKILKFVKLVT